MDSTIKANASSHLDCLTSSNIEEDLKMNKNTKDEIQCLVNHFNTLDSQGKVQFFHAVVPTLSQEEVAKLTFSISLVHATRPSTVNDQPVVKCEVDGGEPSCYNSRVTADSADGSIGRDSEEDVSSNTSCDNPTVRTDNGFKSKSVKNRNVKVPRLSTSLNKIGRKRGLDKDTSVAFKSKPSSIRIKSQKKPRKPDSKSPYLCNLCGKQFLKGSNLTIHFKTQHCSEKLHKCDICQKGFHKGKALEKHKLSHEGKQEYSCSACDGKFITAGALAMHVKSLHKKVTYYQCEYCPRQFVYEKNLLFHRTTHTGVGPRKKVPAKRTKKEVEVITCKLCQESFDSRHKYNSHRRQHNENKRFGCEQCGKLFFMKQDLDDHRVKHTGELQYVCEICHSR